MYGPSLAPPPSPFTQQGDGKGAPSQAPTGGPHGRGGHGPLHYGRHHGHGHRHENGLEEGAAIMQLGRRSLSLRGSSSQVGMELTCALVAALPSTLQCLGTQWSRQHVIISRMVWAIDDCGHEPHSCGVGLMLDAGLFRSCFNFAGKPPRGNSMQLVYDPASDESVCLLYRMCTHWTTRRSWARTAQAPSWQPSSAATSPSCRWACIPAVFALKMRVDHLGGRDKGCC